jgi:hypothetical protein
MQGGCYCGALRYGLTGSALMSAQCHCRECQYFSGGGPNYYMVFRPEDFAYLAGSPRKFARQDLDAPVTREFCGRCGTHLVTRRRDMPFVILKAGTLDHPESYGQPAMAIYTCDRQPFHLIEPSLPQFPGMPPRG